MGEVPLYLSLSRSLSLSLGVRPMVDPAQMAGSGVRVFPLAIAQRRERAPPLSFSLSLSLSLSAFLSLFHSLSLSLSRSRGETDGEEHLGEGLARCHLPRLVCKGSGVRVYEMHA